MVKEVTIKGKQYPIFGGIGAMMETQKVLKQQGVEMTLESLMTGNAEIMPVYFYFALAQGAWEKDTEIPIKLEEASFALSGCFEEFLMMIPDWFPGADDLGKSPAAKVTKPKAAKS